MTVIHDILAHHRALEAKWHAKKIKLHQRLALRLFQEVVTLTFVIISLSHLISLTTCSGCQASPRLAPEPWRSLFAQKCRHREKSTKSQGLPEEP